MSEKAKTILIVILACLLVYLVYDSLRCQEQLRSITELVEDSQRTVQSLRDGLGQQEQIIRELTECQSRVESTVDGIRESVDCANEQLEELTRGESTVDGDVGSIKYTINQLERTIDSTIQGIDEEGIE